MIVLDTHVLLWWASGNRTELSPSALTAIEAESAGEGQILVSSISAWEIAMLVERGRIALTMDVSEWLGLVSQIASLRFVPVDNDIAVRSVSLPGAFHKDPADRIIVATARSFSAALVSADEKIRSYEHVRTVW